LADFVVTAILVAVTAIWLAFLLTGAIFAFRHQRAATSAHTPNPPLLREACGGVTMNKSGHAVSYCRCVLARGGCLRTASAENESLRLAGGHPTCAAVDVKFLRTSNIDQRGILPRVKIVASPPFIGTYR
jgi:hypothetical protein